MLEKVTSPGVLPWPFPAAAAMNNTSCRDSLQPKATATALSASRLLQEPEVTPTNHGRHKTAAEGTKMPLEV